MHFSDFTFKQLWLLTTKLYDQNKIFKISFSGAEHLHDLALLITWPHGGIISVQPSNNKDYLGVEYLQELLKSNPLQNLTQLHLFTRDTRSKKFLDKNCAEFLLRHFVSLKHFGTLKHWKLTRSERSEIVSQAVKQNRNITFDEDLKANKNTENAEIRKRFEFYFVILKFCLFATLPFSDFAFW